MALAQPRRRAQAEVGAAPWPSSAASSPSHLPNAHPEGLEAQIAPYLTHLRVQRRLSERSITLYRLALARLHALAAHDGVALQQARAHHLRHWAARLREHDLAARSVALHLSAWRGLYRFWARDGLVPANPVQGLKAPKAARLLPKALSVEQAMALADTPPPTARPVLAARDVAIVELLYGCGLRVAEVLGLDAQASPQARGWVNLDDATAHVRGKGDKPRSVPVGEPALKALRQWLVQRPQQARGDEAALFVSQRGTRLSAGQLRLRLRALGLAAGLDASVHPHMLRHSFASHLLQSSGDLRAVQELLGHASIATTQVYTKLDFQHLAKTYDAAHPRARKR